MVKTDAEIAREALNILDRDGWCQGMLTMDFPWVTSQFRLGSHCLGGAVNLAMYGHDRWYNREAPDSIAVDDDGYAFYLKVAAKVRELHPDWKSPITAYPVDESPLLIPCLLAFWNNDVTESDVRTVLEKIAVG
jgi:hypothetical protein